MKTYSAAYRRHPKGILMTHEVKANDFFDAVKIIRDCSSDEGPVIVFLIELPTVTVPVASEAK